YRPTPAATGGGRYETKWCSCPDDLPGSAVILYNQTGGNMMVHTCLRRGQCSRRNAVHLAWVFIPLLLMTPLARSEEATKPDARTTVRLPTSAELSSSDVDEIRRLVDSQYASLFELYRDFHQHPELSLKEERTSKRVADLLKSEGYEVTSGVGGYGVVAL